MNGKGRGWFKGGRGWLLATLLLVLLFILLVGPWPVDETPYREADYGRQGIARLERSQPAISGEGELLAGFAVVDITPLPGVPLAGYSARNPKANQGLRDPVFVKALSLQAGEATVTLLSADYLLPIRQLIKAVSQRTGVERGAIYYTATHTHSGPGGYGDDPLSEYALGDYDPAQFERMVSSLSRAVLESRASLRPARFRYRQQQLDPESSSALLRHALDPQRPIRATLNLLQLLPREGGAPIASLVSFPAHPTLLSKHNRLVSGDYPGVVQRELQKAFGGEVLFAIGAVGGSKGQSSEAEREARVEDLGRRVADHYRHLAEGKGVANRFDSAGEQLLISATLLRVRLPPPNLQLLDGWRVSPLAMRLVHDEESYIHLLRLGDLYLAGYPADFSIDLADRLRDQLERRGLAFWPTSFNGDYIGYLMPQSDYSIPHYETRRGSLYGPWGGDYLADLTLRLVDRQIAPISDGVGKPE